MKRVFFEQYPMTDKEKKNFLQNGLLVFDTNVLLNLYFYTTETKNKMFSVMEKCKDRIWLPYQVGWEFFNNRKDRIEKLHKSCDVITSNVNEAKNRFSSLLNDNFQRHPYIVRNELIDLFKEGLKPLEEKIAELKKNDPDYANNDTIWEKLEKIYDGKTGEDYPLEMLETIYKEGEERYSFEIPPGYADIKEKKERGPRHLYGDVIIWRMVIDYAKEKKKDVVFVTEEKKEDWLEKKREPRKDLLKEFFDKSEGHKVLICGQEEFLYLADRYLGTKVGEDAIKEIKEVADEERKREEELNKRRAATNVFVDGWKKSIDSSALLSGVNVSSMWNTRLTPEAYSGVTGIPLSPLGPYISESGKTINQISPLYDPKSGLINPYVTLEEMLSPRTPEARSWDTLDIGQFLGGHVQSIDDILGKGIKDEDRQVVKEEKKEEKKEE